LHLETRNALSLSDELGRYEHALGNEELAAQLAALRTALSELERGLGRSHEPSPTAATPSPATVEGVGRGAEALRSRRSELPVVLLPRLDALVASADRLVFGLSRPHAPVPSKPLLGILPIARVIPQDVHSVADYVSGAAFLLSAKLARTSRARACGTMLALSGTSVSLLTDYRLSIAKLVPIEVHEASDHLVGLSGVVAPFVLGYAKKDPIASAIQIVTGLAVCVASLFTDYRASKGVTYPIRSKGGPDAVHASIPRERLPDAQRPLEGLSSAPTDWRPDEEWHADEGWMPASR